MSFLIYIAIGVITFIVLGYLRWIRSPMNDDINDAFFFDLVKCVVMAALWPISIVVVMVMLVEDIKIPYLSSLIKRGTMESIPTDVYEVAPTVISSKSIVAHWPHWKTLGRALLFLAIAAAVAYGLGYLMHHPIPVHHKS